MLSKEFLSAALAAGMAVAPLQNCLGKSDTLVWRDVTQVQCAEGLTPLDLSKFTFDNDVSYLSATEQEAYRKCQTEFFESLKHLPYKKQRELKEIYKWVPDSIKIIASRDYQDRKGYIQQRKEITSHISSQLFVKQRQIPKSIKEWDITRTCSEMLVYRYPLDTLDFKKQSLEDIVKKCGFGNLAGMIDYCNNPQNIGKRYSESVDKSTYNKTMEEVDVTRRFADKYPDRSWALFLSYAREWIDIPWVFDLKKIDTSNLTPVEYKKMERLLNCLPPGPNAIRTIGGYRNRMSAMKKTPGVLESPEYIQKYAQDKKGIRLSAKEAQEAYQLGL